MKAKLEEADAKVAEANRRDTERRTADQQTQEKERLEFQAATGEKAYVKIDELVAPLLANNKTLTDFTRKAARTDIDQALLKSLSSDEVYQARLAELHRLPPSPEAEKKILNLMMSHVNTKLGPIVKSVLAEATKPVLAAAEEKKAKVAAQIAATNSEPRTVTGPAAPQQKAEAGALYAAIKTEYAAANGGRPPTPQQMTQLYAEARSKGR